MKTGHDDNTLPRISVYTLLNYRIYSDRERTPTLTVESRETLCNFISSLTRYVNVSILYI